MDQPKKFRIVLKPLHVDDIEHETAYIQGRIEQYKRYPTTGANDYAEIIAKYQKKLDDMASQTQRIIDADLVKVIDDASMLIGIDPGNRVTTTRAITSKRGRHAKALKIRKDNPEFYHIGHTAPGVKSATDPSSTLYIITRKFKKILSVNLDNVISVNGKSIMGSMRNLDKGIQQLGLDEDWSIDQISDLLDE